ncbi:PIN domain-containing protein [Gloeobacter violaceus]|uniref:PIN domain-containing protein n=1 Tax=Gloeobacter violaceus TaxID=33072 RepID=UPI0013E8AC5E|nr:PIN domain-containing protein [Gloeobacter violaceus]
MSQRIPPPVWRVLLDLNVFVAYVLGLSKGRTDTAAQFLVQCVRDGSCALGPLQLVVSWGMLNRLEVVLMRLGYDPVASKGFAEAVAELARLGPFQEFPSVTLGGMGVVALKDEEDAHVLGTAVAGRARILITANFKDFDAELLRLVPGLVGEIKRPDHDLLVAHPKIAARWFREGNIDFR